MLMMVICVTTGKYAVATITIMSIGIFLCPILFIIYNKALKNRLIRAVHLLLHCVVAAFLIIREIVAEKELGDSELTSLVYLWGVLQVTMCSSQVAFNFLHTVIFCVFYLVMTSILSGYAGSFDLAIIPLFFYFVLICLRKYSNIQDSYKNYSSARVHKRKSKEQSDLVSQLLPKHAYEKLKNQNS